MIPRVRLSAQAAFLLFSLSVFFGLIGERHAVAFYHSLHLFPVLSQALRHNRPPMAAATGALLLVSLLFGRLYCSFLCPAGFIQDLSRKLGRALGLDARPAAGWTALRFSILGLCLGLLALKSSSYHYFDHFSNLGRLYGLARALPKGPFGWNSLLGLIFLAVIVILPLRRPRWFCGALCPSGTLYMMLQALAPGKVRGGGCPGDCGRCAEACPALCVSGGAVDGRLCVNCLECVPACSTGALSFKWRFPWRSLPANAPERPPEGMSRGEFLAAAGCALGGAAFAALAEAGLPRPGPPTAVVPPGGKDFSTFLERCVACGACVSVCPTKVLSCAGRGLGPAGLAKARLDFASGYCAYECNACLSVCPSGAISYFPPAAKKRIRIGTSRLLKGLCVPYSQGKDCGACQEACPTGAVAMEPRGSVYAPVLKPEHCIGCGACQFACPTKPRKAIEVYPVRTQIFAEAPRSATELDCRKCGKAGGGQSCWRCRAAAEKDWEFPF